MENLKSLVHKLDVELGSVGCRLEVLSDIQEMLTHLVTDMNDKVHQGHERAYFYEWHRELRVLSELMRWEIEAFNEDFESTFAIKDDVFEKVVRQVRDNETE